MNTLIKHGLAGLAATLAANAVAESTGFYLPAAEACYQQTVALERGVDPARLRAELCDRALAQGPETDAHRSAMLHNRALIEMAQGRDEVALASLEEAVRLAGEIGPQHVALAQLAARTGHNRRAAELYRELATSESVHPLITDNRELFRRNGDRLAPESVAGTTRQRP